MENTLSVVLIGGAVGCAAGAAVGYTVDNATAGAVVGAVAGAAVAYIVYKKVVCSCPPVKRQIEREFEGAKEEGRDFIYLSQLEPLLREYGLRTDVKDEYFVKVELLYKLIDCLIKDGEKYVIERIEKILNEDEPVKEKAEKLINEYDKLMNSTLKKNNFYLIEPTDKSVKIYVENLKKWLKEFGINEEEARKNFPEMMPLILEKIYNKGKNDKLYYFFRKNIEALKNYLEKDDEQSISEELSRIRRKIT